MTAPNAFQSVRILGVPMDLGQGRRGVDMGPSAIRYAQLHKRLQALGYTVHDCGNIEVPLAEALHSASPSVSSHMDAVVQVCESIYRVACECRADHEIMIVLGGDHSVSVGSISAVAQPDPIGVIWVDAHADFNTPETTLSGNVHGMPLAALCGDGAAGLVNVGFPGPKLHPSQVVLIGVRDLDPAERQRLSKSAMHIFTMTDIDQRGMGTVAREAISRLTHLPTIHVSLDMDSLDPEFAPGVGTPVPGGLTYREAHLLMELLAASGKVRSMDIVEVNPILDQRNQTAELSVALAASLLGQRIL